MNIYLAPHHVEMWHKVVLWWGTVHEMKLKSAVDAKILGFIGIHLQGRFRHQAINLVLAKQMKAWVGIASWGQGMSVSAS